MQETPVRFLGREDLLEKGQATHSSILGLLGLVKNPPAMRETWFLSWDGKIFLEKGMATHSSILAWRIQRKRNLAGYCPQGHKELDMKI